MRQVFSRDREPGGTGEPRPELLIRAGGLLISGLWALSGAVRKPEKPASVDRLITLTVTRRDVVAHDHDVIALTLSAAPGVPLPRWHPGAHLDVHLPSGRVRQYSLCGDPADPENYRIAVRRLPDGGGGSTEVHDGLRVGATVTTHGPRNAFPLTVPGYGSPTTSLRFIAGGIGITPILPMLALAQQVGADWSMVYAGRSLDSLPFVDDVLRFGERVAIRTDDVAGVPDAADLLGDCPDGATVYACGPAPMLNAIRSALIGRHDVELHFERFAAAPVVDGSPFEVTIASSGHTIHVGAGETLLAALGRAGVFTAYSCQQGFCGTCRTRVLDGVVEHRDMLLTEPERAAAMMLTCVSRGAADGRLVLDI